MTILLEPNSEPAVDRSSTGAGGAPILPRPRGPISGYLIALIADPTRAPASCPRTLDLDPEWLSDGIDALADDDLHLALHVIYELSYRVFAGVDDRWERDGAVLDLRAPPRGSLRIGSPGASRGHRSGPHPVGA